MFERDVTISLNADVSNYSSSLSQAIAITQQYSSAADSALGAVAKLNAGFVQGLVKVSSGLTGPQRMATDTAAAYQQQLSGLQATAAVTGQNFEQLGKTTRALARSFPIGMTQAVQQVQALQGAGVTSNKEIEKLAVSFTKLGAANNAFGPELGQQMLQVTRAFGNGTSQIDALGDSLTTVSKKMGASASGVLTFSKALAPIASTVGMSQTSVMGLSAAMSRLGEDGFMAANSFNKVLLDMNRGIREGGPELKVYSDLLNMTSESLRKMADTDPTEVLIRFTEAIGKAGPDVQRTLDALGLDGVRTTRSIQALSRSGNLREAVNTAVGAYGDGSTNKAAEEAFSGVNDQMTRLSESMRQTVASAGRPFLGFMEDVIKVSNAVSDVTNTVMESKPAQTLATAGIVGGVGLSLLTKGLAATSLGSMVVNLMRSGRDSAPFRDFQAARESARAGVPAAPGSNTATRLGSLLGTVQGPPPPPGTTGPTIRDRVGQTMRTATGAVGRYMDADRNSMATARGAAAPVPMSAAGTMLRSSMADVLRNRDMASLSAAGAATRNYMGTLASSGGAAGLAGRAALYTAEGARTAAAGIGRGAMAVGRFAGGLGITPQLAAVAGAGTVAYLTYQRSQENNDRIERIRTDSTTDIFASFNAFAEAAGQAGKGLVNFSAAVNQATNNLAKRNTTLEQATTLSPEEAAQAMSAGYEPGFKIVGEAAKGGPGASRAITQQALALLGQRPDNESISRVISDVASQTNTELGKMVGQELYKALSEGGAGGIDVSAMISDIIANTSQGPMFMQTSEEAAQLSVDLGRSLAGQSYRVSSLYGEQAGQLANLENIQSLYNQGRDQVGYTRLGPVDLAAYTDPEASRRREGANNLATVIGSAMNLSPDQINAIFGETPAARADTFARNDWNQIEQLIRDYGTRTGDVPSVVGVMDQRAQLGDDWLSTFKIPTELEKSSYSLQDSFTSMTGTTSTLSQTLYGVNDAARAAELTLGELASDPAARKNLSQSQQLVLDAISSSRDPGTVTAAATDIARRVLNESGGDFSIAQGRLSRDTANAMVDSPTQMLLKAAVKQLELLAAPRTAAMPQTDSMLRSIRMGRVAQQLGPQSDQAQEDIRLSEIGAGTQAQADMIGMARGFLMQKAQLDLQLQQARDQAGLQMSQMSRDYNISVGRANEDFRIQEQRANRDFNIQMNRQEVDYQRDRRRAKQDFHRQERWGQQDFNRQVRHATQDQNLAMARMERDYNKQVRRTKEDAQITLERAERDYQKARTRAVRDFGIQMARMEADYNLQRSRATEDYNKSIARANEDYQRQRARAQRDFNKQQAYSEADYLKGRARAVEDYNKQVRRLVEDSAKNLYDPFKRIQAELVMDGGQLVANLAAQSKALADQLQVLDQLRASGLSQKSIDVLGLADTKNAQQAMRLLADSMADPSLIATLNEQIAGRVDLTQMFVTSEDNVQTRRMAEDFSIQMSRMEEDFKTSSARASDQFATSMSDMSEDFSTQMTRAGEDFSTAMTRMSEDYATAVSRARDDQARALADMAEDHRQAMDDAATDLARTLARMGEDYASAVRDANQDFARAMARMLEEYNISVRRSRELFALEMDRQDADFARMRRRAQRDFERQMRDAEKDFQKMLGRMAQDYANALADMGASLALAEKHALQSLIAYGQNVAKGEREIFRDFGEFIASLPSDMQKNMGESMRGMLQYMAATFPELYRRYFPNGLAGVVASIGMGVPTPQQRDEGAGPRSASTPEQIPTLGRTDAARNPMVDQWVDIGQQSAAGYLAGFADEMKTGNAVQDKLVDELVNNWKKNLGISSPSRVFMELGKNTIAGFIKGITESMPGAGWMKDRISEMFESTGAWLRNMDQWIPDQIKDSWNRLTDNMPDVGKALKTVFVDPGKFLLDIGKWIPEKVGKGWDELVKGWPDIEKGLKLAFADPGKFLTDLKTWIPEKIGNSWNKLTASIPGGDDIKRDVVAAFDKLKSWLGVFDEWVKQALPGWSKLVDTYKAMFLAPAQAGVNALIQKWNDFELRLGPLTVEVLGQRVTAGPWTVATPDAPPVRWFAQGGIVSGAQTIGVGEAGPEAVIPLNQRGAQIMADTLRQFIGQRAFDGSLSNPYVINVDMADVTLDFSDSGSEFSQQARELLQRVKDAAKSAEAFMQAAGTKITGIVDDVSGSLEDLAAAIEEAFSGAADEVAGDTKSIKDAVVSMNDAIESDFGSLTSSLDTDLTDLTSSFSTAVDSIITETDRMIAEAISRLENFANSTPSTPEIPSDPGTPSEPGTPSDPGAPATPADPMAWSMYSAGYGMLSSADKQFVDTLTGGALTEESFGRLSAAQQGALTTAVFNAGVSGARTGSYALSEQDRATLTSAFSGATGGGGGGGGTPTRDLSFRNYNTLRQAVSTSDQDFLTAQFGGTAPTSQTWSRVTTSQRDALISALEDRNITRDERDMIKNLSLPNLGPNVGGETGDSGDESQRSWDVFRAGYRQLSDNEKELVKDVFGGQAPTYELWTQLSLTQQRRLRDAVRDGSLDRDDRDVVRNIDPYRLLGGQIVDSARRYMGRPYVDTPPGANPPSSFDCSKFTAWVYAEYGKSIAPFSDTQFAGGRNVTGKEMPGDLVFFHTNPNKVTGHVGIYIGGGQMIDAPSPGRVVSINQATSRGDYKGARRYFAEGGIVNRRQDAVIGEAGPEVVVPLNERGANFFASAMARYTQPTDARQAMVSPYSTPVSISINQTYDNRTMFTGPIEVAANNPDEFAAKAAAKQRRQRLSQPVGTGR